MVTSYENSDFNKLVNLCPVKTFSRISTPGEHLIWHKLFNMTWVYLMLTKVWWKDLPEIFKTDEKMVFDSINQDTLDR